MSFHVICTFATHSTFSLGESAEAVPALAEDKEKLRKAAAKANLTEDKVQSFTQKLQPFLVMTKAATLKKQPTDPERSRLIDAWWKEDTIVDIMGFYSEMADIGCCNGLKYAMLRKKHTLVSYPYYAKSTDVGDQTQFKHVDLNLSKAMGDGLGVEMIKGSVSLTDEDEDSCSVMLLGFHKHVEEYLKWRKRTGRANATGYIEGWKDREDWTEDIQNQPASSVDSSDRRHPFTVARLDSLWPASLL
ncbi:hypothetical protein DDE82_008949 [Stemphylium lycopersici]|nr:hypothetical protein TW65_06547 [Stemphylium lycopersici]RAQ98747.1 hypothetical protein DDE82_008949 [Stemphylium lycopersici]